MSEATRLLDAIESGNPMAADRLLPLVLFIIFASQISLILTGMDFRGPGRLIGQELGFADSPPMQFLAAIVAGYAAGFVLVKTGRVRMTH